MYTSLPLMAAQESRCFPFQNDKSVYYRITHGFNFQSPPFHNIRTGHKLCSQQLLEDLISVLASAGLCAVIVIPQRTTGIVSRI